jgi:hypothetical protein
MKGEAAFLANSKNSSAVFSSRSTVLIGSIIGAPSLRTLSTGRRPKRRGRYNSEANLRTYASFFYQAGGWDRARKVVARLECSLQPDIGGEITSTGMRQEVDIRYVVTLKALRNIFTRTSIASAGRWRT